MSTPAVARLQQLEPRRLREIGSPDMADDNLSLGQRRDQPLHIGKRGQNSRVELFGHLAENARRYACGKSTQEQCFHQQNLTSS
jgi:hypothetical protein